MKNIYFLTLVITITLTSCNQNGKKNEADSQVKKIDTTGPSVSHEPIETALYTCPMHPEVQGEKDTECPQCGMKLTEPVSKK